ncbi:MAG: MAPEG family protein [Novosphingobium sp.]|nr:MAPEG family protein [Novosphingobium sp.]
MLLGTTLSIAAAAALVNVWLANRIGRIRHAEKISIGDGGNELLARRIRAQLNFAENVPLVLILIGAIELAGKGGAWLPLVGALFILARIAHGIGMDGALKWGRAAGTMATMLIEVGMAIAAVLIAIQVV